MDLKDMIYRRKSVRSYTGVPVEEELLEKIKSFSKTLKPLYPQIRVCPEIVGRAQVKSMMPWTTPQLIAIFSERKPGYLENAGFMFQQLDLYLQSIGLGSCWLGLGKPNRETLDAREDGLEFVILIAFGYPKGESVRNSTAEFKRKTLAEISDRADEKLEPARLAPSSVNSQPWYFTHEGEGYGIYCARRGIIKTLGDMNRIDIGIALAHMYVSNPESFVFCPDCAGEIKGHAGLGYFTIK